jgi:hypothetical protein
MNNDGPESGRNDTPGELPPHSGATLPGGNILEEALKSLDPVDKAILGYIGKKPASTNQELADFLKISESAVRAHRRKPAYKLAESELLKPALQIFQDSAAEVARNVLKIHRDQREGAPDTSLRAGGMILDRILPVKKVLEGKLEIPGNPTLSPEQFRELALQLLKEREKA